MDMVTDKPQSIVTSMVEALMVDALGNARVVGFFMRFKRRCRHAFALSLLGLLVLPPLNESLDANAPYSYITTISQPLGEQGYYVYPVAVVDAFMKDNGLQTPADMHAVSLKKIDEIIGPDAVLYVNINEFGQKFQIISSTTKVGATANLVDVKTEQVIWSNDVDYSQPSNSSGQGGLLGDLISAAVTQVASSVTDETHDASKIANRLLIQGRGTGLLPGPLPPEFVDPKAVMAANSAELAPEEAAPAE